MKMTILIVSQQPRNIKPDRFFFTVSTYQDSKAHALASLSFACVCNHNQSDSRIYDDASGTF